MVAADESGADIEFTVLDEDGNPTGQSTVRRQGWGGLTGRANGGMIVHLGVVMVAVGLVASGSFIRQGDFSMDVGETITLPGTVASQLPPCSAARST